MRNITLTFYLNRVNYGYKNVCLFKENVGCFGVCCRKPFVMWTIKRVFAWQWKFMVALLCPNNSHIVSRTDSPAEEQQACYQSYIFAYCPASSLVFIPSNRKKVNHFRTLGSFWILTLGFLHPKINTFGWDELLTSGVAAAYISKIVKTNSEKKTFEKKPVCINPKKLGLLLFILFQSDLCGN